MSDAGRNQGLFCDACGAEVSSGANFCPTCAAPQSPGAHIQQDHSVPPPGGKRRFSGIGWKGWLIVVGLILAVVISVPMGLLAHSTTAAVITFVIVAVVFSKLANEIEDLIRPFKRAPITTRRVGIPLEVKRQVWERDGGVGQRCGSTFDIQYDHVIPLSLGGANTVENLNTMWYLQ
jgi:HNH endonuclease